MTEWKLSRSCEFQGQTVRYDFHGDGAPLVLVHGTPWSSFNWRHLIPRLAEKWTVYFYDLLGYGQSEMRKAIPGSQFVPIPRAGHLVQEDEPESLFNAVQQFLS